MRGGDVSQAFEVHDEVDGQPGGETGVDGYGVDARGEDGGVDADGQVVDDGAVGDGAFGGGDVVDGRDGSEEAEWDVGCQSVDEEGGEHAGGADAVEGGEEVEGGHVGEEGQGREVDA